MQDREAKRWAEISVCFSLAPRGVGQAAPSKPVAVIGEVAGAAPLDRPFAAPAKPEAVFGGRALPSAPPSLASRISPPPDSEAKVEEPEPKAPESPLEPPPRPSATTVKEIQPVGSPPEEKPAGDDKAPEPVAAVVPPISAESRPAAPEFPKLSEPSVGPGPVVPSIGAQWTAPPRPPAMGSVPPLPTAGPPAGGGLRLNPIRTEGRTVPAPIRTPESLGLPTPPAPPRPAGVLVPPPPPIGFMARPDAGLQPKPPSPPAAPPFVAPTSFSPPAAPPAPIAVPATAPAIPVPPSFGPMVPPPFPAVPATMSPMPPAVPPVASAMPPPPAAGATPAVPEPKKAADFFKKMAWKKGPE